MMMIKKSSSKMRDIIDFAREKKLIIAKEALNILLKREDWKEILEALQKKDSCLVDVEAIKSISVKKTMPEIEKTEMISEKPKKKNFKIRKDLNFSGVHSTANDVNSFLRFFREKFSVLKSIIEERRTFKAKPIAYAKKAKNNEEVAIIGMVYKKWTSKTGHVVVEVEDFDDRAVVVFPKENKTNNLAKNIMVDDVIGIRAVKGNGILIAREFIWPDIPMRQANLTKKDVFILSISDMHVGSKLFYEEPFERFLSWLNSDDELAKKIEYMFIVGDNVDGIGIYPGQYKELEIKSIKEQYKIFSEYILRIPKRIDVFIIPGQHDAVRWADPQPPIQEKLVPELYEEKNIHLLSSPSWVEIEGVKILLYHGSCLHDVFSSVSGLSYDKPQAAVIELLKRRDLMAGYGIKHPFVPEDRDYMVLREVPDIVLVGDLHHIGYAHYRGTTVINNSTWQGRTEYQIKQGHIPTPGIAIIMNLKDRSIYEKRFISEEYAG